VALAKTDLMVTLEQIHLQVALAMTLWSVARATTRFKVVMAKTDLMVTPEQIPLQVALGMTPFKVVPARTA
jgi:hypothetical protein